MDAKTLEALKASIAKWERNAEAKTPDVVKIGVDSCALCELFHDRFGGTGCAGCPVKERTKISGCEATPYERAAWLSIDWKQAVKGTIRGAKAAYRNAARAEVDFLKSLLPTGAHLMCNACHNMCCGSDQFEGCGCDHCDEPDCWSDDFYEDDFDDLDCACNRPSSFQCVQIIEAAP